MKCPWTGLAIALATQVSCIVAKPSGVNGTDAVVDVTWSVRDVDGTNTMCPAGVTMAQVIAQPVDPTLGTPEGAPTTTLFDCNAQAGTIMLVPDPYVVSVRLQSSDGSMIYADSLPTDVLTFTIEDTSLNFDIYNDGGYVQLSWNLVNSQDQVLDCEGAGVTDIRLVLTPMADAGSGGGSATITDPMQCALFTDTTSVIPEGTYSVAVNAESNGATIGTFPVASEPILGTNRVSGLGTITIPIGTN